MERIDPLIRHFEQVLQTAAQDRRGNWIEFERRVMWEAINDQRKSRGKSPVPIQDVERVENMAVGHTDYAYKFALYCAELVLS